MSDPLRLQEQERRRRRQGNCKPLTIDCFFRELVSTVLVLVVFRLSVLCARSILLVAIHSLFDPTHFLVPMSPITTVFGVGCSLLYNTLMHKFRISERFRLFWFFIWNTDDSKDLTPLRVPASVLEAGDLIQQSNDGSTVRLLLSPNSAATSSLHLSVISIVPGQEVPSYPARAVEFYYVLSGAGSFSQQGVAETNSINPGDCFVVDVGSMRWISNSKKSVQDLVLLRATDGGLSYSRPHPSDRIRRDPNYRAAASMQASIETMLATGLRTVQVKARDYYKNSNNGSSGNIRNKTTTSGKTKIRS